MVLHQPQEIHILQGRRLHHNQTRVVQLIQQLRGLITQQDLLLQHARHPIQVVVLIVRAVHLRITVIRHRVLVVVQEALIQHLQVQAGQAAQVVQVVDADNCIFQSY